MQGGLTFAGLREPASLPAERSALPLSSVPPFSAMTANGGGWLPQGSSGAQLPAEEQLCDLTNLRRFGGSRRDSAETSSCWVPKMHELQPFWKSVCQYLGKLTAFAVCSQVCAVLSHFSHVPLFVTLWTAACQAPLPMGILQARILEWVAMSSSRGSFRPTDRTLVSYVSCIGRQVLYHQGHLGCSQVYAQQNKCLHLPKNVHISFTHNHQNLETTQTPISSSVQFSSVAQSCLTLYDPMDCSTPGFPAHHQLPELSQTLAHRVSDAIQPSHPLLSPCPPTFNLSQQNR